MISVMNLMMLMITHADGPEETTNMQTCRYLRQWWWHILFRLPVCDCANSIAAKVTICFLFGEIRKSVYQKRVDHILEHYC